MDVGQINGTADAEGLNMDDFGSQQIHQTDTNDTHEETIDSFMKEDQNKSSKKTEDRSVDEKSGIEINEDCRKADTLIDIECNRKTSLDSCRNEPSKHNKLDVSKSWPESGSTTRSHEISTEHPFPVKDKPLKQQPMGQKRVKKSKLKRLTTGQHNVMSGPTNECPNASDIEDDLKNALTLEPVPMPSSKSPAQKSSKPMKALLGSRLSPIYEQKISRTYSYPKKPKINEIENCDKPRRHSLQVLREDHDNINENSEPRVHFSDQIISEDKENGLKGPNERSSQTTDIVREFRYGRYQKNTERSATDAKLVHENTLVSYKGDLPNSDKARKAKNGIRTRHTDRQSKHLIKSLSLDIESPRLSNSKHSRIRPRKSSSFVEEINCIDASAHLSDSDSRTSGLGSVKNFSDSKQVEVHKLTNTSYGCGELLKPSGRSLTPRKYSTEIVMTELHM